MSEYSKQVALFILFFIVVLACGLLSWLVTGGEMGPNLPPDYTR